MNYPPKINPSKLNFDQFHPTGDHWPFTRECRGFYGGGRIHLKHAWRFHWSQEVARFTKCKVGLHQETTWFVRKKNRMFSACINCGKRLGPNQPMDQIE